MNQDTANRSLQIVDRGVIAKGVAGTRNAIFTYPNLTLLSNGTLVAMLRSGSGKDTADETVNWFESQDEGKSWRQRPFPAPATVDGIVGSSRSGHITELSPGKLIAAVLWVDRSTFVGEPLFNPKTEGCLPMQVLISNSHDNGENWTPWIVARLPEELGPPSLTAPILKLPDGRLAMSIESNKAYLDSSKWYQRVVLLYSHDLGQSWSDMQTAGCDPTGRIFNWDQRIGLAPDGRLVTFNWTYDSEANVYRHIHRRISVDLGTTWSLPTDVGFADQAGRPAILPDGQMVVPYVDRFGTQSIRARWARDVAHDLTFNSETILYQNANSSAANPQTGDTATALVEMSIWNYGLPAAERLPSGDVIVGYYAGTSQAMDACWIRLRLPQ